MGQFSERVRFPKPGRAGVGCIAVRRIAEALLSPDLDDEDRALLERCLDDPSYSAYSIERGLDRIGVTLHRARISEHREHVERRDCRNPQGVQDG